MAQASGTTQHLWSIAAADASHAWAVGLGGTILSTEDGGASWSVQASGTANNLIDVACRDARHGCIAGNSGLVLLTLDGGAHWTPESTGTSQMLWGITQPTGKRGWAVGNGPTVLAYDPRDVTPPSVTDDAPAGWKNSAVTVLVRATDSGLGVDYVEYRRASGGAWT